MITEGRITDESIKSKLYVDEYGLFREKNPSPTDSFCNTCGHQFSDVCGGCESLEGVPAKYKRKTNADRIRNMTDKELANWHSTVSCNKWHSAVDWLEWLEKEVET